MTEYLTEMVSKYWVILAIVFAYFQKPDLVTGILSKVGLGSKPKQTDAIDLLAELSRMNSESGFGADEEIKAIFGKVIAKHGKP